MRVETAAVEAALHRLYVAAAGAGLRREERKKAAEVAGLLAELPRAGRDRLLVDAAAGKGYLGVLAVELAGWRRVIAIEREPRRAAFVRALAARHPGASIEVREGAVEDAALWPREPHAVAALHACGAAADAILDGAVAARARWILVAPCCYGRGVPFAARAEAIAGARAVPRHAEVRRRFVAALVDGERVLRLEAAGYETVVVPFVAPTVTAHHLVFRARRVGEPKRMAAAAADLARLRGA